MSGQSGTRTDGQAGTRTDGQAGTRTDGQALWRGTFNQWQAGLAGHVNIQHTAQVIDDARQAWLLDAGINPYDARLEGTGFGARRLRIDFRKEMTPGDAGYLTAIATTTADGPGMLSGHLVRSHDGVTLTRFETGIDRIDLATGMFLEPVVLEGARAAEPLRAMPTFAGFPARDPAMQHSWLGTVEVRDGDSSGRQTPRGLFDVATRALWATQIQAGLTRDLLQGSGIGSGVSALQVTQFHVPALGDLLSVHTGLTGFGKRSCGFRHLISDVGNDRPIAVVDYVLAFFDRRTGQPAPPDDAFLARAGALLMQADA